TRVQSDECELRNFMPDEFDDSADIERQRRELNANLNRADEKNAWWRDLLLGTNVLDVGYLRRIGATPLLLVKLMKLVSDADLLLCRTTGLGSLRVVIQFDPAAAKEIAAN